MTTPAPESLTPLPQPDLTPTPTKRSKAPWIVAGAVGLLFVVAAIILAGILASEPAAIKRRSSPLLAARDACGVGAPDVRLDDGDKTLLIDGVGEEDSGASIDTTMCILGHLETPAAVIAKMEGTNALAGRQEASWDRFTASWTYHPDNGLDLIVQVRE